MKSGKPVNPQNITEIHEDIEDGIMVVDDSKFARNILCDILRSDGFQVVAEAKNGLEAVDMARQKRPKYIFLDVEMPIMDGLGAIPKILEVTPKAHIIMCTAMGQKNIIVEAVKAGAKDYVIKPYKKENILRVLNVIMGSGNRSVISDTSEKKETVVISENEDMPELEPKFKHEFLGIPASDNEQEEKVTIDGGETEAIAAAKETDSNSINEAVALADPITGEEDKSEFSITALPELKYEDKGAIKNDEDIAESFEASNTYSWEAGKWQEASEEIENSAVLQKINDIAAATEMPEHKESAVTEEPEADKQEIEAEEPEADSQEEIEAKESEADALGVRANADSNVLEEEEVYQTSTNWETVISASEEQVDIHAEEAVKTEETVDTEKISIFREAAVIEGTVDTEKVSSAEEAVETTGTVGIEQIRTTGEAAETEGSAVTDKVSVAGEAAVTEENVDTDKVGTTEEAVKAEEVAITEKAVVAEKVTSSEEPVGAEAVTSTEEAFEIEAAAAITELIDISDKEDAQPGLQEIGENDEAAILLEVLKADEDNELRNLLEEIDEKEYGYWAGQAALNLRCHLINDNYTDEPELKEGSFSDYFFSFIWNDRFNNFCEKDTAASVSGQRVSFQRILPKLESKEDLAEIDDFCSGLLSGLASAYLNMEYRLQTEERGLDKLSIVGRQESRLFSGTIIKDRNNGRSDITISDLITLSVNKETNCSIIRTDTLSKAVEQLIRRKAERTLIS